MASVQGLHLRHLCLLCACLPVSSPYFMKNRDSIDFRVEEAGASRERKQGAKFSSESRLKGNLGGDLKMPNVSHKNEKEDQGSA